MSDDLTVTEHEHDVTRVFAANMPDTEAKKFASETEGPEEIAQALGVDRVNPKYVDVVRIRDLGEIGLLGYLSDGHGISEDALSGDAAKLNSLAGTVLVAGSAAFGDRPVILSPSAEISHIGTYGATQSAAPLGGVAGGDDPDVATQRGAERTASEGSEPVDRSMIRWIVIGALVVAAILVAMVAL